MVHRANGSSRGIAERAEARGISSGRLKWIKRFSILIPCCILPFPDLSEKYDRPHGHQKPKHKSSRHAKRKTASVGGRPASLPVEPGSIFEEEVTESLDSAEQHSARDDTLPDHIFPFSVVFVPYCDHDCCESYRSNYRKRDHQKQDIEHRGEGHPFLITKISREADSSSIRVTGCTSTTLSQRKKFTLEDAGKYLRLEGGNNQFLAWIDPISKDRHYSSEPDLFLEGENKMKEASNIEISEPKSFSLNQVKKCHGKILKLNLASRKKVREKIPPYGR